MLLAAAAVVFLVLLVVSAADVEVVISVRTLERCVALPLPDLRTSAHHILGVCKVYVASFES